VTTHHAITVTIEPDLVDARFACTAPPGADCRWTNGPGCECESWAGPFRDAIGTYHETDDGDRHYMVPSECTVLPWLENAEWEETYRGQFGPVRSGPIDVEWNDDGYTWSYPEEAS